METRPVCREMDDPWAFLRGEQPAEVRDQGRLDPEGRPELVPSLHPQAGQMNIPATRSRASRQTTKEEEVRSRVEDWLHSTVAATTANASIFFQAQQRNHEQLVEPMHAHNVKVPKFDGDPLAFSSFMRAFQSVHVKVGPFQMISGVIVKS